jgi:hypothetical protein
MKELYSDMIRIHGKDVSVRKCSKLGLGNFGYVIDRTIWRWDGDKTGKERRRGREGDNATVTYLPPLLCSLSLF